MASVDFYLLTSVTNLEARNQYLCRLVEKAYLHKHRVYIHTDSKQLTHQLDELLWTFKDVSFIPHNLLDEGPDTPPPVQLGDEIAPNHHRDILINLTQEVPSFCQQFKRIIELVPEVETIKEKGREKFAQYKQMGFALKTHKITH